MIDKNKTKPNQSIRGTLRYRAVKIKHKLRIFYSIIIKNLSKGLARLAITQYKESIVSLNTSDIPSQGPSTSQSTINSLLCKNKNIKTDYDNEKKKHLMHMCLFV